MTVLMGPFLILLLARTIAELTCKAQALAEPPVPKLR
jgi:hypothetical protein